jgi:S-adenosylmethionine-dependent methyltransferase
MTPSTLHDNTHTIQALYDSDPEREWQRMDRHRTEFAVTLKALRAHLPAAPARILDCGGGPGRYAIALAQLGYGVTLFDLSPGLLDIAVRQAANAGVCLDAVEQGTATDLSRFPDASFDAVLLMGPLYHLLEESQRVQALRETYRVVKPGGTVFAAFIARYAGHIDAAARYPERAPETPELFSQILKTGLLPPDPDGKPGFVAYFAHPQEVAPLCNQAGLEVEAVLGVEGVVSGHERLINALDGEAWTFWVDVNYDIAQDPSIHGGVEHLLVVCRRAHWRAVLCNLARILTEEGIPFRVVGGASLALRCVEVKFNDLDLEMPVEAAYRFQELFADHAITPVAWRVGENVRSHFGQFEIDGIQVEVMAGLERRRIGQETWAPSCVGMQTTVTLEGRPIPMLELEAEALAALRRGRLERAAQILPYCDEARFRVLLAEAQKQGYF